MNLKEFAELSGVIVERCDPEWGGTWAYRTKDHPSSAECGYRTEKELYVAWAKETFGKTCYNALKKLLEKEHK